MTGVELTGPERWLLEGADDTTFRRKPSGVKHYEARRLGELGLLAVRRERKSGGGHIMATMIKRTGEGRRFLGLPPLNPSGES